VHGVEHGGNCSGIPTPQGFVYYDARCIGKPLVFVGTVGLIPRAIAGKPSHAKVARPGDVILMAGGRVGADGIHGATFSSVALDAGAPATAVQIGDPITQKKLCDALLEVRDRGWWSAITDNGAGGLSSSVGEMGARGFEVDLDAVPLKYPGLAPWQIWVSESQERMTLAVPPAHADALIAHLAARGVEAAVIGRFTDSGRAVAKWRGEVVLDIPLDFVHDGAPVEHLRTTFTPGGEDEPPPLILPPHAGPDPLIPPPGTGGGQGGVRRSPTWRPILHNAKTLRKNLTTPEVYLWMRLRGKQLGHSFRKQYPIPPYIADFACPERKLIVEIDGEQHAKQEGYDTKRTAFLESQGFCVLRFWNTEVLANLEGVVEAIWGALHGYSGRPVPAKGQPPPNPPLRAGGGMVEGAPLHAGGEVVEGTPLHAGGGMVEGAPLHAGGGMAGGEALRLCASAVQTYDDAILALLARPNIATREHIATRFDHGVQGGVALGPLQGPGRVCADATVIRPLFGSPRGVVLSHGLFPRYGDIDTGAMAAASLDYAVRAAVAAGADPGHLALLDNFCWCSSHDPARLGQLKRACAALYEAAVAYGTPFISGKDSMFNDFKGYDADGRPVTISAPPTTLISGLGVIADAGRAVDLAPKAAGDRLYLLGPTRDECGGSEYYAMRGALGSNVPRTDLGANRALYRAYGRAAGKGLIASALPLGLGGLAAGLAKKAIAGGHGLEVDLSAIDLPPEVALFSESTGRVLVTVAPAHDAAFTKALGRFAVPLGHVAHSSALHIAGVAEVGLDALARAYRMPGG
jgi:phosphoribosylformylglycinamidine (FGAM) synthase-like enzyme/very-short-patch-repair endonuclease